MATLSNPRGLVTSVVVILLVALVGGAALIWRQSVGSPELQLSDAPRTLGRQSELQVQLRAKGGKLAVLRVVLEQGDQSFELFASDSLRTKEVTLSAPLAVAQSGAKEGEGRLHIYASDNFWRPRSPSHRPVATLPVLVDLTPPPLEILAATRYPEPGGAALVVMSTTGAEESFVEIEGKRFAAYPRGAGGTQVCLYAVSLDHQAGALPRAVAVDAAGNRNEAELPVVIPTRPVPTGKVELSETWLEQRLPQLLGRDVDSVKQDLAGAFRAVSIGLRAQAAAERELLSTRSADVALWNGRFRQLPNSSVLSRFGVRRTYRLGGEALDAKIHQGLDLASVRRAKIPAANDGRVVFAGPLTIYGNAVIIDHGLGLMTLYGHCSSLQVEVGQAVERGQTVALTGATGLAVGDHLHFEVMVGGIPVTPIQWFDGSWIESHIEAVARDSGVTLRDRQS